MRIVYIFEEERLDSALIAEDGNKDYTFDLIDEDRKHVYTVRHSPTWATTPLETINNTVEKARKRFKAGRVAMAIKEDACPACGTLHALESNDEFDRTSTKFGCGRCGATVVITYQPVAVDIGDTHYDLPKGDTE